MSNAVYPVLPGLAYSVFKNPSWATRLQRGPDGREARQRDWQSPIYTWILTYSVLHDKPFLGIPSALRTLMDFFNSRAGGFDTFLFFDPDDNSVLGQLLPPAQSTLAGMVITAPGLGYSVNDQLTLFGGAYVPGSVPLVLGVTSLGGGGSITGLINEEPTAALTIVPSLTAITFTGGSGSGLIVAPTWQTTVQPVRSLIPGGFQDNVWPLTISNLYFNNTPQSGWGVNTDNGLIFLPSAFAASPPTISVDMTYYFRVYLTDGMNFEQFYQRFWSAKEVRLTGMNKWN